MAGKRNRPAALLREGPPPTNSGPRVAEQRGDNLTNNLARCFSRSQRIYYAPNVRNSSLDRKCLTWAAITSPPQGDARMIRQAA